MNARVDGLRIHVLAEDYDGYNSPFWAQHGISFLIEVSLGGRTKRILFDTGSYPEPVIFNARLLGIDLRAVDALVISHSHFDHTGGLLGILKEVGRRVPVIAHPDIFKASFATEPELIYAGIPWERGRGRRSRGSGACGS